MMSTRSTIHTALTAAALLLAVAFPAAAAQVATAGGETALAADATSRVYSPAAAFTDDDAVLVWEGSNEGIDRQRLGAAATPAGARVGLAGNDLPAQVPYKGPVTLQRDPSVVGLEHNRFLSIWVEERQQVNVDIFYQDSEVVGSRVMARRFHRQAAPFGRLHSVSGDTTPGVLESAPDAARLTNHRIAVVWQTSDGETSTGVWGRLLNPQGRPIGSAFRIDDGALGGARPAVAPAEGGGFLVAWQACCDEGEDEGVFVRAFGPDGAAAGAGVAVNTATDGLQIWPAVARGADGGYLAAWMTPGAPGTELSYQVVGRPLAADGTPTGVQTVLSRIGEGNVSSHGAPTLAASGEGFLVAWTTWYGSFTAGIHAATVNAQGSPVGEAIRVSNGPVGTQWEIALAADGTGGFLAAWQGFDADGQRSILARQLTTVSSGSRAAHLAPAGN